MLGAAKDHRHFLRVLGHVFGQQLGLVALADEMHALVDLLGGLAGRVHGDLDRVGQIGVRQLGHQLGHRGREHQRLTLARQHPRDLAQGVDEADVQHLVGLVQHQIGGGLQADRATLDQVHQAARRRDQHVHAARQTLGLGVDRGAAHDAERPDRGAFGIGVDVRRDLGGQLAGRRQDQRAAGLGVRLLAIVDQAGQHRQAEGRRLAGAGLGQAQHVTALHDGGDALFLDRRRRGQAHRDDVRVDAVVDAHIGKGSGDDRFARGGAAAFVGLDRRTGGSRFATTIRAKAGIVLFHRIFRPHASPVSDARAGAARQRAANGRGAGAIRGCLLPPRVNGKLEWVSASRAMPKGCSRGSGRR